MDLGGSKDTFVWNPGDGSDTVDGGDGSHDVLTFNGSDDDERFELSNARGPRRELSCAG